MGRTGEHAPAGRARRLPPAAPLAASLALLLGGVATYAAGSGGQQAPPRPARQELGGHPLAGAFRPDRTEMDTCAGRRDAVACTEQAFGNLAFETGPGRALELLAGRMTTDRSIEANCHRIAHVIGSAALARFGGDVGRTFAAGDATCWSGYYHGVLERALAGVSTRRELRRTVRRICTSVERSGPVFRAYQCLHGLGHGLMIRTGLDLPESLAGCDALATRWQQTSCHGGVFMENLNTSYGVRSRFLRDDDLLFPCTAVAARHRLYCYLQITDRVLRASGWSWRRAARECLRADRPWRATCFQSYGRSASGATRGTTRPLVALCALAPRAFRGDCLYGAARDLTAQDSAPRRARSLCLRVRGSLRERCFLGIGTILAHIASGPIRFAELCRQVGRAGIPSCLAAAPS